MKQLTSIAIGLGSSLGDRRAMILRAFEHLKADVLQDARLSSLMESAPWGGVAKNAFINAVAVGQTEWKPPALVAYLKQLERDLGRSPAERYADREIDLDLLLYGDEQWDCEGVVVPHPRMHEREFVLRPLAELGFPYSGTLAR